MKILSLHYLPPVLWMRHLLTGDCIIDVHEHFIKQTYRNRAVILSANGPLNLTIPVKKTGAKMTMRELEPDAGVNWQRQHWESIVAAYGSTPYFIHYADGFKALFEKPVTHVEAFELELLELILRYLKTDAEIRLSDRYLEPGEGTDLRQIISPKRKNEERYVPYLQIFAERFPFQPNLSVIDALFNLGPRAVEVIG
jgi:hypothetical protein